MNDYYLVPVTTKSIKFNGISLNEILKNINIELYERKVYAMALKYEEFISLEEVEDIKKFNTERFKFFKVPEKIIIVKRENLIYEIGTELPIEVTNTSYLEAFRISSDEAIDFFVENENYCEEVSNFFAKFVKKSGAVKN